MTQTVYFDLETSSLRDDAEVIQLAAIAVGPDWRELEIFEAKIKFDEAAADPEALKLNHYSPEAWANAESLQRVVARFTAFLNQYKSVEMVSKRTGAPYSVARLAGHNAATFDGPRLRRMFQACGAFLPAHPQVMCTLQASLWEVQRRGMKVESLRLESICKSFGVVLQPNDFHDALFDVRASVLLAKAILLPCESNI